MAFLRTLGRLGLGRAAIVLLPTGCLGRDGLGAGRLGSVAAFAAGALRGAWALGVGAFNPGLAVRRDVATGLLSDLILGMGGIAGASSLEDLLLPPLDDGGREPPGLSGLKKLDLRRRFAGDGGIFAIDSTVRSANEGRDVLRLGLICLFTPSSVSLPAS